MRIKVVKYTRQAFPGVRELVCKFSIVGSLKPGPGQQERTLARLDDNFSLPKELHPALISAIEEGKPCSELYPELDKNTTAMIDAIAEGVRAKIEKIRLHGFPERSHGKPPEKKPEETTAPEDTLVRMGDVFPVASHPVGAEKLILDVMRELDLEFMMNKAGLNPWYAKMNLAAIIARMCDPKSDRATREWLIGNRSLGLLMGVDFLKTSGMTLHRAADALIACKEALDAQIRSFLSSLRPGQGSGKKKAGRIFRIDCTNVHFEGRAKGNPMARRGHSKAKRFDCKLVSFAIAIDENGFVETVLFLPGNVSEPSILSDMLKDLGVREGDIVMMDAGIATRKNLELLESMNILYVVSTSGGREEFNFQMADKVTMEDGNVVSAYRVVDPTGTFAEIKGHSTERAKSDMEYNESRCARFKAAVDDISEGLSQPHTKKDIRYVDERLGREKQKHGVGRHFKLVVNPSDVDASLAASITCTRVAVPGSKADCPGVYCFRTNNLSLNALEVVELYRTLVEIESVFRCLKSELGVRPIYHSTARRTNAHIYISVLAYQLVNYIRLKLKKKGINYSWTTIRDTLKKCHLVGTLAESFDGKSDVLMIRNTLPTEGVKAIYMAMGYGEGPKFFRIWLVPRQKDEVEQLCGRDGLTATEWKLVRLWSRA
jgi:transposase